MSDKPEFSLEEIHPNDPLNRSPQNSQLFTTVELPSDLVDAVHQQLCRTGETPTQAILEILQSFLQHKTESISVISASTSDLESPSTTHLASSCNHCSYDDRRSFPPPPNSGLFGESSPPPTVPFQDLPPSLLEAFEHLNQRLTQLEALIPRLVDLEGKLIAF